MEGARRLFLEGAGRLFLDGAGRLFLDGGHRAALLGGSKAALLGEGRAPLLGGAQKKHLVKRCFCDPVGIRTQDPQLRRLLLYPAELPDPIYSAAKLIKKIIFCNSFSHSRIKLFLTAGLCFFSQPDYYPTVRLNVVINLRCFRGELLLADRLRLVCRRHPQHLESSPLRRFHAAYGARSWQ